MENFARIENLYETDIVFRIKSEDTGALKLASFNPRNLSRL